MKKTILDLCGGTGAWSEFYKKNGYNVLVLTLPVFNINDICFAQNYLFIKSQQGFNDSFAIYYKDIYGILAAPPCTEFSLAKGGADRDFAAAMKTVESCLQVIWHCRIYGNLKFWALENPVGFLRQFLGKPAYTFEQWEFGENKVKRTDIWGYFNMPATLVKKRPDNITTMIGHRTHAMDYSTPVCPEKYKDLKLSRADLRAITPAGFAKQFYKANK